MSTRPPERPCALFEAGPPVPGKYGSHQEHNLTCPSRYPKSPVRQREISQPTIRQPIPTDRQIDSQEEGDEVSQSASIQGWPHPDHDEDGGNEPREEPLLVSPQFVGPSAVESILRSGGEKVRRPGAGPLNFAVQALADRFSSLTIRL